MTAATALAFDLPDEAATSRLAAALAARARLGDVIGLSGALGTGKTTFARAFIRALGSDTEDVPSPTFTLVEIYAFAGHPPVWHFDLYRLAMPEQAYELGIEDAFAEGISLIEWPERLGRLMPEEHALVSLAPGRNPSARTATISFPSSWSGRLEGLGDD
ncbi:MAG TPA: tRNA (adenosine(37)-N6)-threonylcarbamoyltransferase complex ATPase subunit type 1 TsaE [Stellaceae bacterium]|nr:tRNA (adenosine(37)-N6)-threonylcarbamoyltransferase complex ATPase subunit type 1 TsaE [Stellaceae bacterium]